VDDPSPPDGLLQGRPNLRIEGAEGRGEDGSGDAQALRPDAVEALVCIAQRLGAAITDVVADRADHRERRLDVELGTRQGRTQVAQSGGTAAEIDDGEHGRILFRAAQASSRVHGLRQKGGQRAPTGVQLSP
jgi:hypothetical protein